MEIFLQKDILEIQDGYWKKQYSVQEAIQEIIASSRNCHQYAVWKELDEDGLLKAAASCQKKMERIGRIEDWQMYRLFGIPFGYVYATEIGERLWKKPPAGFEPRVVAQMKEEGGIAAGITAREAAWQGMPLSGSQAAVALGFVPAALTMQTDFGGVFGYQPTYGTVPRAGMLCTADSLDSVGFVTANIKNIRTIFEAVCVKGPDYPFVYRAFLDYGRQRKRKKHWKIACTHMGKQYETDLGRNCMETWIKELEKNSACKIAEGPEEIEIEEIDLSGILSGAGQIQKIIYEKSLSYYFEKDYTDKEQTDDTLRQILADASGISMKEYQDALAAYEQMCVKMDALLGSYDVLVSVCGSNRVRLQCPFASIPFCSNRSPGKPVSIQITAGKYQDYRLLDFLDELLQRECIPQSISRPGEQEVGS